MKKRIPRFAAVAFAVTLLMCFSMPGNAATSDNAIVTVTSGSTLTASILGGNFGATTYSFSDSAPLNGTIIIRAVDARGTAPGWHVTIKGADFAGQATSRTFPIGKLSLAAGTSAWVSPYGNSSVAGLTASAITPVTTSFTQIWSAAAGSGDGVYDLTIPGSIVVPGGTRVDQYWALLTVSIDTGP